jgi:hypothetical protein
MRESIAVSVDCELVVMGPPQPARLVIVIAHPPVGRGVPREWDEPFLVNIAVASHMAVEHYGFGTVQGELSSFLTQLRHIVATGEGGATLLDEDGQSYVRFQSSAEARGFFRISGRFYSVLIDTEDIGTNPEEAAFFERRWGFARGFQGLRVHGSELSRVVGDQEAGLTALGEGEG